jgi:hypothetical protein
MHSLARFTYIALALVAVSDGSRAADAADQVVDRIVETWRWSHYWFGKTGIDGSYAAGRKVSALVFWNDNENRPMRGLCSSELGACLVYSGAYLDPAPRRMEIAPNVSARQAFMAFVTDGFRDSSHILAIEGMRAADFQSQETSIILPTLEAPTAISHRDVPAEARTEAEKVKQVFRCSDAQNETPTEGCSGSLVFAFYGPEDPYWFVVRSCSEACEFKGESVEMLRRGDHGWEVTSAGFIDRPKAEVERLKQQIEKAEMFRLQLR